ncbi:GTP-binding proten HflX [Sulfuricella denitrificans skB26]|uniref:GTPase HflX n=1 Tax=Sulfuricella denitrificans (strain DSM 22764 / NBRC 105220 / skB26) TaxID=1163617 RepID=S6B4W2_SULDS|nr:ribosome rescue GTPase HflX [Sulfuricella denitrificans]BAN35612.1 GTP-binding proten HflX [Sulfuricella denitrificans skB26]
MIERPGSGDAAVLVSLDFGDTDYEESLEELQRLTESAGVGILGIVRGKRSRPDAALFAGSGKADEIGESVIANEANLVIFNHELSPAQQRNLEQRMNCRVIDRTSLILDIFAQRAQSHEGKLQVELAQLEHLATRLVRGWTHLERQKGGIGLRGPGETQLETDRRLLGKRVKLLKEKLAKLGRQRCVQRRARVRANVLSVSIVGYTNAGKSTLFNRLTHAKAYVADQLFATLDTTSRKFFVADGGSVVLSDTVGFIKHLPHTLVAAFRATLEEAVAADLLLHVVDASSPGRDQQIEEVNKVLAEIGADHIPQLMVLNKIDVNGLAPGVERDEYGRISRIWVSARTGEGFDLLREALAEYSRQHQAEAVRAVVQASVDTGFNLN